jgi:hypothetical protein
MSRERKTVSPPPPEKNGSGELKRALLDSGTVEGACTKLAHILHVARHEIALFRLEKTSLRFVYPSELRDAGTIPLSSSAVAARTAVTRTSLLSNSFARVRHVSLFESVTLHGAEDSDKIDPMPIQKILSVPMIDAEGKVIGVIQISRKGIDSSLSGPDFTTDDLRRLEQAAEILATMALIREAPQAEQIFTSVSNP